ncbi:MAG: hypothetical protein KGJ21_07955 [Pseudomonadota bacterium]|nr:hypothetical protein [Pseudomonadota bacterium]
MNPIHMDRIGALNLVKIVFHDKPAIIQAWKGYFDAVSRPMSQDINERQSFDDKCNTEYARLISAIAKILGIGISEIDIMKEGYIPASLGNFMGLEIEWRQSLARLGKEETILKVKAVE